MLVFTTAFFCKAKCWGTVQVCVDRGLDRDIQCYPVEQQEPETAWQSVWLPDPQCPVGRQCQVWCCLWK